MIIIVLSALVRATVKILREYERGVVFTLDQYWFRLNRSIKPKPILIGKQG